MTAEEKTLIDGLFDRLRQADTSAKDPEALQLINARVAAQPSAPYLLTQAVLVQEHALANAQARIADLERQLAASRTQGAQPSGSGGFLSGVTQFFTGKPANNPVPPPVPQSAQAPAYQPVNVPPPMPAAVNTPPYPSTVNLPPNSGGSFLKTALTTAAGVAGGAVLFQGIENLIGHRAGPFEPGIQSGGGFFPQNESFAGTGGNTEIINNYYETPAPEQRAADQPFASDQSFAPDQSFTGNDPDLVQNAGFDSNDSDFNDSSDFGSDDREDV